MTISSDNSCRPDGWLRRALERFAVRDADLLTLGAGEPALSARIACHLAAIVPDYWDVDAEYDREFDDWARKVRRPHRLPANAIHMRPDIVVHIRGASRPANNLMMVEVKRQWLGGGNARDLAKARAAIKRIGYQFAVVLGLSPYEPNKRLDEELRFQPYWTVFRRQPAADDRYGTQAANAQKLVDSMPVFESDRLSALREQAGAEQDTRRQRKPRSCS